MIDVQPYIDKLDKLRQYCSIRIDNAGHLISVNYAVLPTYSFEYILSMFHQTGILYYNPVKIEQLSDTVTTFEQWLKNNQQ